MVNIVRKFLEKTLNLINIVYKMCTAIIRINFERLNALRLGPWQRYLLSPLLQYAHINCISTY